MALETTRWDMAESIKTPEDAAAYVEAAFEDGDPAVIAMAIGAVARARGIVALSRETGLTRPALYKAFGEGGNPTLTTLSSVLKALGLKLSISVA